MRYVSTRGKCRPVSFETCVLDGLAPDGGLYVPESVPKLSPGEIEALSSLSFTQLSLEVISRFTTEEELPRHDLCNILEAAHAAFTHEEVTPVVRVGDLHILELFHGPTLSFKDVALQFLGGLFEYFLKRHQRRMTVVGATSGDTGSAAIHGLRGRPNIDVFILFPKGRVSAVQERQMTTVVDANIRTLVLPGTFDDCQNVVKALFNDAEIRQELSLGAVNSINFARIVVQIVYYFYAYFRVRATACESEVRDHRFRVVFSVPTGNFGDILAGFFARSMGLPVDHLIVATNENDILHRFFTRGEYHKGRVVQTISPSMDIQISSNFERYLYYVGNENPALLRTWMDGFAITGRLTVSPDVLERARNSMRSFMASQEETLEEIARTYRETGYLLDPHTAIGVRAARDAASTVSHPIVCLATAHPCKFGDAVSRAVGKTISLPHRVASLFQLPTRRWEVAGSKCAVAAFLRSSLQEQGDKQGSSLGVVLGIALLGIFVWLAKQ